MRACGKVKRRPCIWMARKDIGKDIRHVFGFRQEYYWPRCTLDAGFRMAFFHVRFPEVNQV